jgi:hypothetical protein
MLRRNFIRLGGGGGKGASAPTFTKPGAALGLGDEAVFRTSQFFRSTEHPAVTSNEIASEAARKGHDAASQSFIDYVELQWLLIPYRFRKLVLEVQEVRKLGIAASLPSQLEDRLLLVANIVGMILVYLFMLRVGRGTMYDLKWPKKEEEKKSEEKK